MYSILRATKADLPEILALQLIAYQSEAKVCQNPNIPPLQQTLADLEEEHDRGIFLKAVAQDNQLIGSIRGYVEDGTGHIGKLMVDPAQQGQGIGSALLRAVEDELAAGRLELFTSVWSEKNLGLYQRRGYVLFKEITIEEDGNRRKLQLAYLEKMS